LPAHSEIYASHAAEYERLVSREDYLGNILPAIQRILPLDGLDVLDLGSGIGRLACLLAPYVHSVIAMDVSTHMLQFLAAKRRSAGGGKWPAAAGDHRTLPLRARSADLIVSGWSVSYLALWNAGTWREAVKQWFDKVRRVLRKAGHVILFESLGTGNEVPVRLPHRETYYHWLDETGFSNLWIRTDYRSESVEIAHQLAGFFFGEEIKRLIKRQQPVTLAECSGVWWRRF
jgi:ubiquinone/menaquinone biosynthesis C-methylase UbiE